MSAPYFNDSEMQKLWKQIALARELRGDVAGARQARRTADGWRNRGRLSFNRRGSWGRGSGMERPTPFPFKKRYRS